MSRSSSTRRVRLHRRRFRVGQVDDHPPAHRGTRADSRAHHRRRARPRAAEAFEVPMLPPQRRVRLPGLQAPPQPHCLREHRVRAQRAGREPRQDQARCPRCWRSSASRTRRARIRVSSGGEQQRVDRARCRQPSAAACLRRADREPRPGHVGRHHAAPLPHQQSGTTILAGHPRPEMVDKMRKRVIALDEGQLMRDERRGGYE